ncbi:hypothetical protein MFUM_270061 [Methylacidiphilum fumariolicum SolV]|uniref:Uncharacterized protein n=2 Tax=Candidatus Methylacidiphilum fumarolicum TaxID=591154 RepID=I0JXJ4_METFB|nr:conserved protein of unknown function [Candidatus Methylacidiphilum fumarolicum]CCG91963.1 hypothetical protein MFUM_270061 [Methylacidiphilum fumariolicum SolV]
MSYAGRVGAYNLKKRIGDCEIIVVDPLKRLYVIILGRFTRNSG